MKRIYDFLIGLVNKYTTGVPFLIWAGCGLLMASFLFIFRNFDFVRFDKLIYVLAFSMAWFIGSDVLKKRKTFNEKTHFLVDSIVYIGIFSSIYYFTGGIKGDLFFVFFLVAISGPLFSTFQQSILLALGSSLAIILVNELLYFKKDGINYYLIGTAVLIFFIQIAIVSIVKFFQSNYEKTTDRLLERTKELEKLKTSLENSVKERTRELENAQEKLSGINFNLEGEIKKRTKELEEAKASVEKEVQLRTKELKEAVESLEQMNKAMTNRELKMIELKQRIKELEASPSGK